MPSMLRRLAVVTASLFAFTALAPVALAAAPGNDVIAGATTAAIGFSEVLDTTEATTDADDAQLNVECGAPATDASVWYTLDGADQGVIVDVSSSDYSAGILVGIGLPGALGIVTCGPGAVAFFAEAGSTYYVLAFDDQLDGSGNGGLLDISFSGLPDPPTLDITLDRAGSVDTRTGVATLSGTFTCTNADFVELYVDARQTVGRFIVRGSGWFFDVGTCDGSPHGWSADVYPENGKFAGGRAMSVAFAYTCGIFECAEGYAEQSVMLRGKR